MKKIVFAISMILLFSCNPRIYNTPETLDKVFAMSAFEIEIGHAGCFGGSTDIFEVKQSPLNNYYSMECIRTGKSQVITGIEMAALKEYFLTRIDVKSHCGCTIHEYIRVGTFFHSVDSENRCCNGELNEILKYTELAFPKESQEQAY